VEFRLRVLPAVQVQGAARPKIHGALVVGFPVLEAVVEEVVAAATVVAATAAVPDLVARAREEVLAVLTRMIRSFIRASRNGLIVDRTSVRSCPMSTRTIS